MKEILRVASREWHALREDEKQVYRDESERDKILSDQQMGIVTPVKGIWDPAGEEASLAIHVLP